MSQTPLALAPRRSAALTAGPPGRGWLGLVLSTLCLVHCLGAAALVPLLPAAFSFLTENPHIEWSLLLVSVGLSARICLPRNRLSGLRGAARSLLWLLASGVGIAGLLLEQEILLQAALATLALLQLATLVGNWRVSRASRPARP